MPGTFTFRPIEANLTHKTDLLTKMNPYCSFTLGSQKFNSEVCKKGGKHPQWNDIVTIPITNENTAILEVMDKDRITKDDVVGGCSINLKDVMSQGSSRNWYPLFYKNKPAGEILLETTFQGGAGFTEERLLNKEIAVETGVMTAEQKLLAEAPRKVFTEQHQVVEPHTFMKNVTVTETVPVQKEIEVMEPRKVMRDIEYTEAVPVMKTIEVDEPQVVMKEVEVVEPRVVTKTIEVIENVPVKKQVEVVEMVHKTKQVETFEPQTFTKQVEVTEQVPVMKTVTVSEPVTVQKAVEFVEPVITTQTITKEIIEPVVVNQTVHTEVGPATVIGVQENTSVFRGDAKLLSEMTLEQRYLEEQRIFQERRHRGEFNKEQLIFEEARLKKAHSGLNKEKLLLEEEKLRNLLKKDKKHHH